MDGEFDVQGKTFLITGGDKGLGLETVRYFEGDQLVLYEALI